MKTRFIKAKSKVTAMVADGKGGMVKAEDRRFDPEEEWPIRFEVLKEQAATWLRYFYAECSRHGWNTHSSGQISARENGLSITVNTADQRQLAVIMEHKHNDVLKVRARSVGADEFLLTDANEFFAQVNERCRAGVTELIYLRGHLAYDGLPLRGELWLDDKLRLSPPSRHYETCALGPRIIMVDAQVNCIGRDEAGSVLTLELKELSAFLSVVMGKAIYIPENRQAWTYSNGATDCDIRHLGYMQSEHPVQMPATGACRSAPLKPVRRPDFSLRGYDGSTNEEAFPKDIVELWAKFRALPPELHRRFLQVAAKWQEALLFRGIQRRTLSYTLMIVACEALKPPLPEFSDHNIYHIVEALLGKQTADQLQRGFDPLIHPGIHPQTIRSTHLHTGEFYDSEFDLELIMPSHQDPSFDQAYRELWRIVQACIIEWLRIDGNLTLPLQAP